MNAFFIRLFLLPVILLAGSRVRADVFRLLDNETEALQCRIDLIQQAQEEILASYYIIRDDRVGRCFFHLLLEASARGVRVRVLADGAFSRLPNELLYLLQEGGVEVRYFQNGPWIGVPVNTRRMHEKLLLADSRCLIVGGRNIKDEYYNLHGTRFNFKDLDAYVESPSAAAEARTHFYSIWNHPRLGRQPGISIPTSTKLSGTRAAVNEAPALITQFIPVRFLTGGRWDIPPAVHCREVHFVHDNFFGKRSNDIEDGRKDLSSTLKLTEIIQQAHSTIEIENPYFIPTRHWRRVFRQAREKGVRLQLLTNSVKTNDILIRQGAYMNKRRKLLRRGWEIREWQGPQNLHIKAAVIDDSIAVVGTYNIHYPSERLNTELAVWTADAAAAAYLCQTLDKHRRNAVQIDPARNRPLPESFEGYQPAPFSKRAKTFFWRYSLGLLLDGIL